MRVQGVPPRAESATCRVRAAIAALVEATQHMSASETEAPTSGAVRTSDLCIAGEHVAARDGRYFETTGAPRVGATSTGRAPASTACVLRRTFSTRQGV